MFNVVFDFNREGLTIEVDFSRPSERVTRALDQRMAWRGKPLAIRCDNGPEYIRQLLIDWAKGHSITLTYIQPGNPQQHAYVERYNRTVRYERLNHHPFDPIADVPDCATRSLWTTHHERPNKGLGASLRYRSWPWWPDFPSGDD